MATSATSPRATAASAYDKLHVGLDHALALCLGNDNAVPMALRLCVPPFEAWHQVRTVAADRYTQLTDKAARRMAKRKLKRKETDSADAVNAPLQIEVKPMRLKKEETKPKAKENEKEKTKANAGAMVKMLDLSGANLSPVMTHAKTPPRVNVGNLQSLDSLRAIEATKPLPRATVASPKQDLLTRLRRLPLLEDVDPTSSKYRTLVKWLETDDRKNKPMSASLSTLINKLQKNGVVVTNLKSSPKRQLQLGSETLDDRLKKERQMKKKMNKKNGIKTETKRRKATDQGVASEKSRKRKLGGFVVESDEEEYDVGGWEQDSEAEYESGEDASSFDGEIEFEIRADVKKKEIDADATATKEERTQSTVASLRKVIPPASSKVSPRSTPRAGNPSGTGKQQLASVAAKLRELDHKDGGSRTPTYLSYNQTPASEVTKPSVATIKQELRAAASSASTASPYPTDDGTSESNAIVLDDSDDGDDDDESVQDGDFQVRAAPTVTAASPVPPRKQQHASSAKAPKVSTKPPPKAAGKAKATAASASNKRKNTVDSEDDDSDAAVPGEAEFVAPGEDEDSSTDADEDMFDLNEEDVFVVESILEVKKGRTLMTNSGRYAKDPDLFLVKWEGYDELTWEPEANIPNRIIALFTERERAKQSCNYQIDKFLQRKVARNSTTGKDEILYLIQWKGLPQAYWEVKATLPSKTHIWLEKTSRASLGKGRQTLAGPSPRKKTKS